jgi:hypothetical protein
MIVPHRDAPKRAPEMFARAVVRTALKNLPREKSIVSPTIFRNGPYRFYFFSREELRMHVHVQCPDGEAKFWLEPVISLAQIRA